MRKEYDFSKSKRAKDVPHLKKLKSSSNGKTRITIMLDDDVLEDFRSQAKKEGTGYQTLINKTLRSSLGKEPLSEERIREVIREELTLAKKRA
jgi:uncharacterized protein (DUF4415 family)